MKQNLYTLYDNVAEQFGPVFQVPNHSTAIRSVRSMNIKAYEDFELYWVGVWDMDTGVITTKPGPVNLENQIPWVDENYKKALGEKQMELLK
ncbi:MAG: nonstructural protein [Arizlama microvirus]|nr:MAG: nonstructural protein [Arizlama microvirus]